KPKPEAAQAIETEEAAQGPGPSEPPAITSVPSQVGEDPDVLQSELKSMRQSIVSMSVGRQETASRILNDWLQGGEGQSGGGAMTEDETTEEETGDEGGGF
ncbi:MAG: hypothetical protein KAU50_07565, partial [Candidatus Marinimicrobia bacterium]|nr:hypothetical protein [Candidatus Neomarinimicrobiota bacterium]